MLFLLLFFCRFLLNKLATSGSVEDMLALGCHLSTKIKKDVSYDNRLCNAYLSAGRGAEFLDLLVRDLAMAVRVQDPEMLHIIQERFPRGGAMGLLDNHPELLDKVGVVLEIWIRMSLGLQDPDPFVRGTDPDPSFL